MLQSASEARGSQPPLFGPYVLQINAIARAANDKLDSLEHAAVSKVELDANRLKQGARKWAKSVCTPDALEQVRRAARALVFARLAVLSVRISQVTLGETISWPVSAAWWAQVSLVELA